MPFVHQQPGIGGFASMANLDRRVQTMRKQIAAQVQLAVQAQKARAQAEAAPPPPPPVASSGVPWGWIALAAAAATAIGVFVLTRKKSHAKNALGSYRRRRSNRKWPYKEKAVLDDDSFLLVLPGGKKIHGRTHPLSLRKFPYKDKYGRMDLPHLRNALSRIPQSNLPKALKEKLTKKARAILDRYHALRKAA